MLLTISFSGTEMVITRQQKPGLNGDVKKVAQILLCLSPQDL